MRGSGGTRGGGARLGAVSLLALGALVAGCTSGSDDAAPTTTAVIAPVPDRGNVDGQLVIGVLLPDTGPLASLTPPIRRAVELAVLDINAAGGVLQRDVVVRPVDSGATVDSAIVAVDQLLLNDRVDAVIGPLTSGMALGVLGRIVEGEALTCSPTATAIELASFPAEGLWFRTIPSDRLQAKELADQISRTGAGDVDVLYPDDDYGRGFAGAMRQLLAADVPDVALTPYDASSDSVAAAVRTVVDDPPDAIVVVGVGTPAAQVLAQLADRGYDPDRLPTYLSGGLRRRTLLQDMAATAPVSLERVVGVGPSALPRSAAGWGTRWQDRWVEDGRGLPENFAAYGYDCAVAIALAAQATASDDATRFSSAVAGVTSGTTLCLSYEECLTSFRLGADIDYDGASGDLEIGVDGDPARGSVDVFGFDAAGADVLGRTVVRTLTPSG